MQVTTGAGISSTRVSPCSPHKNGIVTCLRPLNPVETLKVTLVKLYGHPCSSKKSAPIKAAILTAGIPKSNFRVLGLGFGLRVPWFSGSRGFLSPKSYILKSY